MIKSVLLFSIVCFLHTLNYLKAEERGGYEQALEVLSQEENQDATMMENATPEYLYKIISQEQWQESLLQNKIAISPMDEEFIHLAKEDQVGSVIQKFWNNMDCIILKLVSKKLMGRLVYEKNPGGSTQYYHLYEGSIPLDVVLEAVPYPRIVKKSKNRI